MANQITDYFSVYPKPEAIDGIAKHIHASWEPRMRNALKAHIDAGGAGLSPLFLEAMADYFKGPKSPVKPAAAATKSEKATAARSS
ncbi:formate dehydrogenase subunit delta [Hyphomicrobium sp. 99]|uniref:formate dehydrogenase subunit delta n=1 Tax=Hyphomicrobium sp. 99 TaxID=1163419 RepID=UPI0009E1B55F|nr:formate dehydrogenase subunit delta [Hyphomicrobium sp. 99]